MSNNTDANGRNDRPEPTVGKKGDAKKYWVLTREEAAERFDLPYLVEDEEPDASAGWREEAAHNHVDPGRGGEGQ